MRLGLAFSGGGPLCAYAAGAIKAITNLYGLGKDIPIHVTVGASGGALVQTYFVARQTQDLEFLWTECLTSDDFCKPRRSKWLDIDYQVDVVLKEQVPLDEKAFRESPIDVQIATTHARTKKLVWQGKKDIFEVLRATQAVPKIYGREVVIGEVPLVDGQISIGFDGLVQRAYERGATHVLGIRVGAGVRKQTISNIMRYRGARIPYSRANLYP